MINGEMNRYLSRHCETAEGYPRAVSLYLGASPANRYQIGVFRHHTSQEQES